MISRALVLIMIILFSLITAFILAEMGVDNSAPCGSFSTYATKTEC